MPKRTKRSDGRYQARVRIGTVDGKPKYRFVYAETPRELQAKIDAVRLEIAAGVDLSQEKRLTFWIDRFLRRLQDEATEEWYTTCAARTEYWRAALGDRDVTTVTTADLEDVLLALRKRNPTTGRPSSKKTIAEYKNIICRIFAVIAQNRAISYNPANYLPKTKNAPQSRRAAVSDAVISAVLNTPGKPRLACLIMVYAGLRLGEVCALTWSDVDLDAGVLTVNKSYNFKTGQVKPPKTEAGTRAVPIPPPLADALREEPRASLLVVHNNGRRYTRCAWEYALEKYSVAVGTNLRAHNLRHTYASILFEAGIDTVTAQSWMGHADAKTTINIYTHLRNAHEQASAAKLARYLTTDLTTTMNNS